MSHIFPPGREREQKRNIYRTRKRKKLVEKRERARLKETEIEGKCDRKMERERNNKEKKIRLRKIQREVRGKFILILVNIPFIKKMENCRSNCDTFAS